MENPLLSSLSQRVHWNRVPGKYHSQLSDDSQFPECRTATAASVHISEFEASTSASPKFESGSLFGSNNNNNLLIKLEDGCREFVAMRAHFLGGLSTLVTLTSVVGIYRTVSGQVRSQTFQRYAEDVARNPTDVNANVRYVWHRTSNKGIYGIIIRGFGHLKMSKHGTTYGIGGYLAPENCAYISVVY